MDSNQNDWYTLVKSKAQPLSSEKLIVCTFWMLTAIFLLSQVQIFDVDRNFLLSQVECSFFLIPCKRWLQKLQATAIFPQIFSKFKILKRPQPLPWCIADTSSLYWCLFMRVIFLELFGKLSICLYSIKLWFFN